MARSKRKTLPKEFKDLLIEGDIDGLKTMLDRCEVDARGGPLKQTALAYLDCPPELLEWLLERGADINAADRYGETPLHTVAAHWQGDIVPLVEAGANIHSDAGGRGTPLHRASAVGNLTAAKILLDVGADPFAKNSAGQTPLVFTLQRCANVNIENAAPMAELLLSAMADAQAPKPSFLGRILGKQKPVSVISPEAQKLVKSIGENFEFHRAAYDSESVDAVSNALNRLYVLFDVEPVSIRVFHDGKSPIIATGRSYAEQREELWALLVPSRGPAATVQGEVIRISGRISDELARNAGGNWDHDYGEMARALLKFLGTENSLTDDQIARAETAASALRSDDEARFELCDLAVEWVKLNPNPVKLNKPDYSR